MQGRPTGKLAAYVELLHLPPIAMVLLAATGFMAAAVRGRPPLGRLIPFLAALLLTQLAISIHNDYCDRALDTQAKPWRALPRGLLTPGGALAATAVLTALGLLAAVPLGPKLVLLVATGTAAGFLYNARLKRTAWSWLPFWVALPMLVLAAFVTVDRFDPKLWQVYMIGAPLVGAVSIADSLADIESDSALGVRGLAQRLGPRRARFACWGMMLLGQGVALALWPGGRPPGPLFFFSVASLVAAIWLDRRAMRGGHWLAIMASAIALALSWLIALVG